jgi:hypothetical protein
VEPRKEEEGSNNELKFWSRKRQLVRPRHRWGDNIMMDLTEMGCEGVDWIHLGQDRDQ